MIPEHIIVGETQAPWAARQEGQRRCLDQNPKDPDIEWGNCWRFCQQPMLQPFKFISTLTCQLIRVFEMRRAPKQS